MAAEILKELSALPALYIPYCAAGKKEYPFIDAQGRAHIFTNQYAAELEAESYGQELRTIGEGSFPELLRSWERYGITSLRINFGGRLIKLTAPELGLREVYNADLQLQMIRFLQATGSRNPALNASAAAHESALYRLIPQRLFVVPFGFADDDISKPPRDREIRLFPGTADVCSPDFQEAAALLRPGFTFCSKPDGKPMRIRAMRKSATGEGVITAFTDMNEYLSVWKDRARIAFASFHDITSLMSEHVTGIVINGNLLLDLEQIAGIGGTAR